MSKKMQIFAQILRNFTLFIETFFECDTNGGLSSGCDGFGQVLTDLVTTRVALLAPGDLQKKKKTDGRTRLQSQVSIAIDNGETLL